MANPEDQDDATAGRHAQTARLIARLGTGFVVDLMQLAHKDLPVLDALLVSAISQANVGPINQQADLQIAFADAQSPPPDELRRPITINAVASSLGLPFETVRRRVKGLVAQGICIYRDGGVIAPAAIFSSPSYLQDAFTAYERLRAFYYELRDRGLIGPLPQPTVKLDAGSFPIRTVVRLVSDYVLRVIEVLMRRLGDALDVVIVLKVFDLNTRGIGPEVLGGPGATAADMISDARRTPVRSTELARELRMPQETIRRHLASLIEGGLLARVRGGLIIPGAALAQPGTVDALTENVANLMRLFGSLSQLGVLQIWDDLSPPQSHRTAVSH